MYFSRAVSSGLHSDVGIENGKRPPLGLGVEREEREARRRDGVALRAAGDREAAAALVVDAGKHLFLVERVGLALECDQLLVRERAILQPCRSEFMCR